MSSVTSVLKNVGGRETSGDDRKRPVLAMLDIVRVRGKLADTPMKSPAWFRLDSARVRRCTWLFLAAFILASFASSLSAADVPSTERDKAKKALDAAALSYTAADVLQVELPNMPGALGKFAAKLADKGVNITLAYQTTVKGSRKASVVLAVSDLEKAGRVR